jgi:hypothetical protein
MNFNLPDLALVLSLRALVRWPASILRAERASVLRWRLFEQGWEISPLVSAGPAISCRTRANNRLRQPCATCCREHVQQL